MLMRVNYRRPVAREAIVRVVGVAGTRAWLSASPV